MMVKCREVIQLPSLSKLKLVAGESGLERIVKWVHVLDMPDVVSWVRGGELLFMTGMSLKSPMDLLNIVQVCAKKNVAGLVITPGKYVPTIPLEVLQEGKRQRNHHIGNRLLGCENTLKESNWSSLDSFGSPQKAGRRQKSWMYKN